MTFIEMQILLVDDEPELTFPLNHALNREGCGDGEMGRLKCG
ncbi:MAG: hypothetical protein SWX82_11465 [Cyanobacteriota bacterium]|nr:hypothetical protein [Cyanobacteriota bacterium]